MRWRERRDCVGEMGERRIDINIARGDDVVAQQDQEALAGHGVGDGADGVAQAARLVLVAEVDGHLARGGHGVGVGLLAALAQQPLEGLVGLEVSQQLGLAGARHDDGGVDLLRVEGLLHHVLDDRLVEDRQHLLGGALGGGQKAGTEAGGGDDSLHAEHPFININSPIMNMINRADAIQRLLMDLMGTQRAANPTPSQCFQPQLLAHDNLSALFLRYMQS